MARVKFTSVIRANASRQHARVRSRSGACAWPVCRDEESTQLELGIRRRLTASAERHARAASASTPLSSESRAVAGGRRGPGKNGSKGPARPLASCPPALDQEGIASGRRARPSPLQQVEGVHVHRLVVAEDRDDDRQSDGGLRGRHRHHEEDEELSLDAVETAERHQASGSPR